MYLFYMALCLRYLKDVEEEATPNVEEAPKKKKSKLHHWLLHDGIAGWFMQSVCSVTLSGVKYFIKTNFVLTLISMMVSVWLEQ